MAPARPPDPDPEVLARWRHSLEDEAERHRLAHLLTKVPVFARAPESIRLAMVDVMVPVSLRAGTTVWKQRDEGSWMGIVLSGRLGRLLQKGSNAMGETMKLDEVAPGGFIGDHGLLGVSYVRSVTITVADDCVLLVLERANFEAAIAAAGGESRLPILEDAREVQNLMADPDAFRQIPCFRNLDHDFVMTLFETLEPRVVYPGMVLMKEGNYGNEMYILHIGEVKVERGGQHLADCHSGTVLGELAVLGLDKRRTATVTAMKLCLVYVLHGDVFHAALQKFPESRRVFDRAYIAKLLRHELQKSEEEKADLDKFYGSAHPMTTMDFQAYLQSPGASEAARLAVENAVAVENV